MSQHQTRLSRRRPAVFPLGDLDVRPTDSGGDRFNQDRALTLHRAPEYPRTGLSRAF